MKRLILILVLMLLPWPAFAQTNRPAYTNKQHWAWSDGATATNALAAINVYFPITKDVGGKTYKASIWGKLQYSDHTNSPILGKWYIERIKPSVLDYHGFAEAIRQAWFNAYCASNKAVLVIKGTNKWQAAEDEEP